MSQDVQKIENPVYITKRVTSNIRFASLSARAMLWNDCAKRIDAVQVNRVDIGFYGAIGLSLLRGGAVVARLTHTQKAVGSIPTPAI